jgi:glycosyltransferase involved in cell wall biosynthesis
MTIVVPAYNVARYINECVDSIPAEYPVIIGIDGCTKTLEVCKKIKREGMRIYWCPKNMGCSAMRNTLLSLVDDDMLLFDGDDIMYKELPVEALKAASMGYDIVRWKYDTIENERVHIIPNRNNFASGAIFISKKAKKTLGGYKSYRCSADSEFLIRVGFTDLRILNIPKKLMGYRIHGTNLTNRIPMSERFGYHKLFINKKYEKHEIYVKPETNYGEFIS